MTNLLAGMEDWLADNADWAAPVVFAITCVESLPGVSLLVPSTALLVAIGALVGTGTLEPTPVLASAIAGAIVGDAVGFWLSRAYGPRIVRRWLPRRQRRPYARALLLFRRWGWAAVLFGRFLGPVRAVAPLIAGVARMSEWRFQTANVASAFLWAPLMLLPGYAAAQGLDWLRVTEEPVLVGGLILLLAGAAGIGWRWFGRPHGRSRPAPVAEGRADGGT